MSSKSNSNESNGWTLVTSRKKQTTSAQSFAIRAHAQDDSSSSSISSPSKTPKFNPDIKSNTSIEALSRKFSAVHKQFQSSTAWTSLTKLLIDEIQDSWSTNEDDDKGDDIRQEGQTKKLEIKKCMVLALGSMSEGYSGITPFYQLSAILSITSQLILQLLPQVSNNSNDESSENQQIYAFDPLFTDIDKQLLRQYNISTLPSEVAVNATLSSWNMNETMIYIPHGSLSLCYQYIKLSPLVYLGNSVSDYYEYMSEKERKEYVMLEELERGYEKRRFPEANTFYDGTVFNELAVYWRL